MRLRKKHWAIPEMEQNPYIFFEPEVYKGKWKTVFGNENPIHLEIGSGKGSFITKMSKREPNINFIGIEMETNAFAYAARKIAEEECFNVRGISINAEKVEGIFERGEIERIYINFCNPWPKKRHHKRRLTHKRFLDRYKNILKYGSEIVLKTDDRPFFEDTIEYFKESGFELTNCTFDMKLEDYPENIVTEYESKWRSRNIPICHLVAKYK
ncbi:MAG: tRNA (guanosine(46)-N7)-methyltransferase TrmB [Peptoniphilus sp.]|uniref:tRNA (guanosine(46)-N7)-methyltransferase TrmB n=1 Tax=Peptoniphilus sp. TaxID=1971214 RepID=UPI002A7568C8|nr:tRNA (guanosine(46)-N7)-methyltransferase TrmB [Peptoniphilus sp.]MDY2987653.1 tRNA (guanosine(46)-N7)-methyltransferase TrmB [Peptoniphilus sp.]